MSGDRFARLGVALGRLRAKRRGTVVVLTAVFMVVAMGLLALSVDVGYVMKVQAELQRATDAAALAGAGGLVDGATNAQLQAFEFLARNPIGGGCLVEEEGWEQELAYWYAQHPDEIDIKVGHWDPDTREFSESGNLPSTIHVSASHLDAPLFFSKLLGHTNFSLTAESIARYQPRDIVLVLDFSASMNDDSELRRISEYGQGVRATVEANLLQIYQELGSPTFGNMQFTPRYISSDNTYTVKQTLGLVGVSYPWASGSWDDYIYYVRTSSYINSAGYRKDYGYLTLMNYLLEKRPKNNQTADLWKVSAQPITAVKDSVGVFMQYIQEVDTEDRVGLVIYDYTEYSAKLEQTLTENFSLVEDTVELRQAGHYDYYTNIGAGIKKAREELQDHARTGSFKMIVLMTDGIANRGEYSSGTTAGEQYALQQADLTADTGYPIVTISLGNAADTDLMAEIAERTNGLHFNVPGDGTVTDYEQGLLETFRQIANDRPLVLVR